MAEKDKRKGSQNERTEKFLKNNIHKLPDCLILNYKN
jgi:hypothetical protein